MIVEVVLKKQMSITQYKKMIAKSKTKGWDIKAYQIGVCSEPLNEEI